MVKLDGSYIEGGGQIVRTALALSCHLQEGFVVENIRKGRKQPGLKAQHLHCIKTLQQFTDADVEGAELGSQRLRFIPRTWKPKNMEINIGTAGSITLLLQSLLLPCILGKKPVKLTITGGTDGKWAMPFDYFQNVFLPHIQKFAKVECNLQKRGYFPAGGGKIELKIRPLFSDPANAPEIKLIERGSLVQIKGVSHASKHLQSREVAERQANTAKLELSSLGVPVNISPQYSDSVCPGSGIVLWGVFSQKDHNNPILIAGDALGEKGLSSESVGITAAKNLKTELSQDGTADTFLADNLIPFLAFYGGIFTATTVSNHTLTNIYTVEKFLGKKIEVSGKRIKQV